MGGTEKTINRHIAQVALVVDDYDEAIAFYTRKLDFTVVEDTILGPEKRWVLLSPKGNGQCQLLLARAATEEQRTRIGNQTGGRVFLFLHTDHFERDYNSYLENGIEFIRPPAKESYGTVAVFRDLYGNLWDLVGPGSPLETI